MKIYNLQVISVILASVAVTSPSFAQGETSPESAIERIEKELKEFRNTYNTNEARDLTREERDLARDRVNAVEETNRAKKIEDALAKLAEFERNTERKLDVISKKIDALPKT